MSVWEAIKDAYMGAFALLQAWWPFILIVACLCIIGGLLVSEWKHPAEDESQAAPLPTLPQMRCLREAEYVAANAWAGREVWNEPIESEGEQA